MLHHQNGEGGKVMCWGGQDDSQMVMAAAPRAQKGQGSWSSTESPSVGEGNCSFPFTWSVWPETHVVRDKQRL